MKVVTLIAVFCISRLANANTAKSPASVCAWQCYGAAASYSKWNDFTNVEEHMWEECEELAKKSHYNKCSIAVPLILDNEEIKNKIKVWDVEYNLDQVPVQRYCWDACLKAILKPN